MEFFGFTFFDSLEGGALLGVAAGIFLVGLFLPIKGGDWFVDSALPPPCPSCWFLSERP